MISNNLSPAQAQSYILRIESTRKLLDFHTTPVTGLDTCAGLMSSIDTSVHELECGIDDIRKDVDRLRAKARQAAQLDDTDQLFKWKWTEWRANIDNVTIELSALESDHIEKMHELSDLLDLKRRLEVIIHAWRHMDRDAALMKDIHQARLKRDEWRLEQEEEEWKAEGKGRSKRRKVDKDYNKRLKWVDDDD